MANETKLNTIIQLRADTTANWEKSTVKLLSGEMGLEYLSDGTVKIKAGKTVEVDGKKEGTLWKNLNYVGSDVKDAQVFQMITPAAYDETKTDNELISNLVGSTEIQAGDVAIIKRYIDKPASTTASSTKISYTSYVYEDGVWQAMDGNYSASNVYLKETITLTTGVGNLASGKVLNSGTSLESIFSEMFQKDEPPYKNTDSNMNKPTVAITVTNGDASGEVGSTFTLPTGKISISDVGEFRYGTDKTTGIKFTKLTIKCDGPGSNDDTESETAESFSSTTGNISVSASSSIDNHFTDTAKVFTFTGTGTHTPSTKTPVSKLGVQYTGSEYQIPGATINASSKTATKTGIRYAFYGTTDTKFSTLDADKVATSYAIRDDKKRTTSKSLPIAGNGKKAIYVAVPGSKAKSNFTVTFVDAFNATVNHNSAKYHVETIKVGGADASETTIGDYPTTYTIIYVYNDANDTNLTGSALDTTTYTISWS